MTRAAEYIKQLETDPARFKNLGIGYQLLEEYFDGYSLDTLVPLLSSEDDRIIKSAVWIVSELGIDGQELLEHVVPLLTINDRYIKYHVLEIIIVCSEGLNHIDHFYHLIYALEDSDQVIRILAMELWCNASIEQLNAAIHHLSFTKAEPIIMSGIVLLRDAEKVSKADIIEMLDDDHGITRKFGAIILKSKKPTLTKLFKEYLQSTDSDIAKFVKDSIELENLQID